MMKIFTQNDLIRFQYRETNEEQTREINKALLGDAHLRAKLAEITSLGKRLDDAQLQPSPKCIQNILKYARALQEH